jgi:pentatricopeptide repeat protein
MFHPKRINTTSLRRRLRSAHSSSHDEDFGLLCKQGLSILQVLNQRVENCTYDYLLQGCHNQKALPEAKLVQAHMIQTSFQCEDISTGNKLVSVYSKYGNLADARRVFDQMPYRDVISWTTIISAYSRQGHNDETMRLFYQMQETGIQPNQFTFASVLRSCAGLAALEKVHQEIIRSGFEFDLFVGSALLDMYAKCGSIENARCVFDKMSQRNVVTWNAMIAGYAQNGDLDQSMELFQNMPERNVVSWTTMVAGIAQNGHVDKALKLFHEMPERNVISWNALIAGCAQNGYGEEALKLYRQMPLTGLMPNPDTVASVLLACGNLAALEWGKEIHEEIIRRGFQSDIFVGSALVDMYANCGSILNARYVFDKMPQRDVVLWNALIAGYSLNGHLDEALTLFQQMPEPNAVSWNAMITGYSQKGHIDEALNMFWQSPERNVASWNAMISGYMQNGHPNEALKLFQKMPQQNMVSWTTMIAGYAQNGLIDEALKLFQNMPKRNAVSWTAITAGFVQNGHVDKALKLFHKMPNQNVISWNMIIAGCTQNGHGEEALKLYQQMKQAGVKPNPKTFSSVLSACANLAALEQGKEIHELVIKSGYQSDIFVGNALVDMYAKCGSIDNARITFEQMHQHDVVSWTTIITGYAMHGHGKEALKLFERMQHSGTSPDDVTFLGVLSACCHAGLVDDGKQYFDCMKKLYHITPAMEHYGCMVDLLGRAGRLDEAQNFINKMPIKPDASVWGCLLSACKIHNNVELGQHVAGHLFELNSTDPTLYVLLSNMYATAGRWHDIGKVRGMMKDRNIKKKPGCSWIEVNKVVYAFRVEDRSNP